MCVSIIFAVKLTKEADEGFNKRLTSLGEVYEYGIEIGQDSLLPQAKDGVIKVLSEQDVIFEVHDLPEVHCACDIDDDIRIKAKLGKKSKFFDFVREIIEFEGVRSVSVLFFQEELPDKDNVRHQLGTHDYFIEFLNRWNTWQVEGFEPTRQAYFIADDTPMCFTFTHKNFSQ